MTMNNSCSLSNFLLNNLFGSYRNFVTKISIKSFRHYIKIISARIMEFNLEWTNFRYDFLTPNPQTIQLNLRLYIEQQKVFQK